MKVVFEVPTEQFKLFGKLSEDRIKLFVDIEPIASPEGGFPQVTRDALMKALTPHVPIEMVNTQVLDDCLSRLAKGEKIEERRIIKGIEPETGLDGRLVVLVKRFTGAGEVKADEKGFVEFRQLDLFENISVGQVVARVYPPKIGKDGKDALGKVIKADPGKPFKVTLDKTLTLQKPSTSEEPYEVVVSQLEGYLVEDKGSLTVKEELAIKGNVDFHFGNIDFIGSIRISGDVLAGFTVKAKKGITVQGAVQSANLSSSDGDIIIKGFLHGSKDTKIVSTKNIECSVAHEATLEALGNITIKKEALDCELHSQAAIFASAGTVVGGKSWSVCGAEAKIFGNDVEKETKVVLCSDVEMTTDYSKLMLNIESHEKALELVTMHLGPYAKNPDRISLLNKDQKDRMQKFLHKKKEIESSRIKLLTKKNSMLEKARLNQALRVNVLGTLHEGVTVSAGEDLFTTNKQIPGPVSINYYAEEHAFKVESLSALECSFQAPTEKAATTTEKKDEPKKS